ncbi:hypothetical protein Q1695_011957 [Nippostrongylus brasiliensis]|nr:hypothetical protein Q1695_011957 [Nippostrongylus brasiliensis]
MLFSDKKGQLGNVLAQFVIVDPYVVVHMHFATAVHNARSTSDSRFDNSIAGEPVISCERDRVRVTVATARPFAGKIFVKGEYANPECIRSYINGVPESIKGPLRAPSRERPSFPDGQLGGSSGDDLYGPDVSSQEKTAEYGVSREQLPTPDQASRFTNTAKVLSSTASSVSHITIDESTSPLINAKWFGHGGASSGTGKPYNGAFGGSMGEEQKSGAPSDLKIYPKAKANHPEDIFDPAYPGPQGFTLANCPVKCEPCTCPNQNVEALERRRRETNTVELSVPLGACNTKRDRKASPPTLVVSFVAVVSFHDSFITKLDRAYHIQCAYVESNRSLTSQLEVGNITAAEISGTASPPVCGYNISDVNGDSIQNVRVGDPVRHVWSCSSSAPDLYAILVHSCYVEDGAGQRFPVIDENGCSLDQYILNTPRYDQHGLSATVDAFMMKFPDRSSVDFQCAIQICSKLDTNCTAITPPDCSMSNSPVRRRRAADTAVFDSMTIHANSLNVLDVDLAQEIPRPTSSLPITWLPSELCLSVAGFGILVSASTFLATVTIGILTASVFVRARK